MKKSKCQSLSFAIITSIFLLFSYTIYQHSCSITAKLDHYVQAYVDQGLFNGTVLVAKDGNIVLRKAYGFANIELNVPNTVTTKFNIASVTKQFTAQAIILLQEMGKLSVHDPIAKYIPDYPRGDIITVHQLLTHTSGIMHLGSDYKKEKVQHYSTQERIALFKNKPLESAPGATFSYADSNYILLTAIIEKASDDTYEKFLHDHIFKPLQMHNSGCDLPQPIIKQRAAGYSVDLYDQLINADFIDLSFDAGAGILYSTIDDLFIWDRALHDNKILTKKSQSLLFTPYADHYGYGWNIEESEYGTIVFHQGRNPGFRAIILRNSEQDTCIIILSNFEHCDVNQIARNLERILYRHQPTYTPQAAREIMINADVLQHYVGTYKAKAFDMTFNVLMLHNNLFIELSGNEKIMLHPVAEHEFVLKFINSSVTFVKGSNENIEKLIVRQDGQEVIATKQ